MFANAIPIPIHDNAIIMDSDMLLDRASDRTSENIVVISTRPLSCMRHSIPQVMEYLKNQVFGL